MQDSVNPCPPEWLDNEETALLRVDAIGDTVYTHRWILQCLLTITQNLPKYTKTLELSDENRNSQILELDVTVENAACQLRDMTVEKDVALHLLKLEEVDILQLISMIAAQSKAPRLTEVMIGVLANLCCQEEGCVTLLNKENELTLLTCLEILASCSDVPTLCEVLRLIRELLWYCVHRMPKSTWSSCSILKLLCETYYRDAISFLICNSLSDSLISNLLQFLSSFLFISLPETSLNFASFYSCEETIQGLIDILEDKDEKPHNEERENIVRLCIICLYAFIDTPGTSILQSIALKREHNLEQILFSNLESASQQIDSPEDLLGERSEKISQIIGLFQLLIPQMKYPNVIMLVGRLLALIEGETNQYSVTGHRNRVGSGYWDEVYRQHETGSKNRRKSHENPKLDDRKTSNPCVEECGWVSPPPVSFFGEATPEVSSEKKYVSNRIDEATPEVSSERKDVSNRNSETLANNITLSKTNDESECKNNEIFSNPTPTKSASNVGRTRRKTNNEINEESQQLSEENLTELNDLKESLEEYCYQLLGFWWSNIESEEKLKKQKIILDVLDQCHAHEVLFILSSVKKRHANLVPRLQEQILDLGTNHRLVALLAHMYQ